MEIAINGSPVTVPEKLRDVTLLDFLRDFAGLTGSKYGCGIGLCGACTVHIDAVATRSCQISVADVAGAQVTTIEGLARTFAGGALHPVPSSSSAVFSQLRSKSRWNCLSQSSSSVPSCSSCSR